MVGRVPLKAPLPSVVGNTDWFAESSASETGKRAPEKKETFCPSSARSSRRCALRTCEIVSEKFAVALGSGAKKIVFPPPNAITAGITALAPPVAEASPRPVKMLSMVCSSVPLVEACASDCASLSLRE